MGQLFIAQDNLTPTDKIYKFMKSNKLLHKYQVHTSNPHEELKVHFERYMPISGAFVHRLVEKRYLVRRWKFEDGSVLGRYPDRNVISFYKPSYIWEDPNETAGIYKFPHKNLYMSWLPPDGSMTSVFGYPDPIDMTGYKYFVVMMQICGAEYEETRNSDYTAGPNKIYCGFTDNRPTSHSIRSAYIGKRICPEPNIDISRTLAGGYTTVVYIFLL